MKIFHVIDSGGLYGAEVMLLNLAREQRRIGLDPVIISIGDRRSGPKPIEIEAQENRLPLETFRMTPGPNILGAISLLRRARQTGAQIIHSHGYKGNILLGLVPSCLRSVPLVSTLHGWTSTTRFTRMTLYEALDRTALRFVDAVVCVNAGMLDNPLLGAIKNHRKLVVIDNGISPGPQAADDISSMELSKSAGMDAFSPANIPTIGTIGRLSLEKGYDILIRAFRRILDTGIEARLVIIGEGSERTKLEKEIRQLGLTGKVFLLGYHKNAYRFMARFSVYAISSSTEGLPITLLEAMRARVPVVATRVGGIPTVLDSGKAGILVDPGSAAALADGLMAILNNRQLADRLTRHAYVRFSGCYSSQAMANSYVTLYRQLIPFAAG
ncbi:MAG: hypothetical protein VR64_23500 [Desulfatitalea sp. BRH_c12]|nr:MAG: hypothetical protein VR64_23500 [Desulfatitalea sp. BRH_c12]